MGQSVCSAKTAAKLDQNRQPIHQSCNRRTKLQDRLPVDYDGNPRQPGAPQVRTSVPDEKDRLRWAVLVFVRQLCNY